MRAPVRAAHSPYTASHVFASVHPVSVRAHILRKKGAIVSPNRNVSCISPQKEKIYSFQRGGKRFHPWECRKISPYHEIMEQRSSPKPTLTRARFNLASCSVLLNPNTTYGSPELRSVSHDAASVRASGFSANAPLASVRCLYFTRASFTSCNHDGRDHEPASESNPPHLAAADASAFPFVNAKAE